DLVAFELEEEPKINGTAGKVAGEPACDDRPSVRLFAREWLARVLILGRNIRLPFLDRRPALVGVPFVLHDGVLRETRGNGVAVNRVRGEVVGGGSWQIESHGSSLQVMRMRSAMPRPSPG